MSTPIDRIKKDFLAFTDRVDNYVNHKNDLGKCKDLCENAYEGLYKFKERVDKEYKNRQDNMLTKSQLEKLKNIFDDDEFLISQLKIRNIATHITLDKGIELYTKNNEPFTLVCDTSAGAFFSNNIYADIKSRVGTNKIDHADDLTEVVRRLRKKINTLT